MKVLPCRLSLLSSCVLAALVVRPAPSAAEYLVDVSGPLPAESYMDEVDAIPVVDEGEISYSTDTVNGFIEGIDATTARFTFRYHPDAEGFFTVQYPLPTSISRIVDPMTLEKEPIPPGEVAVGDSARLVLDREVPISATQDELEDATPAELIVKAPVDPDDLE